MRFHGEASTRMLCFFVLVAVFTAEESRCLLHAAITAGRKVLSREFASVPLHFQPNEGQAHPAVQYLARGPGYGACFLTNEVVLAMLPGRGGEASQDGEALRLRLAGARVANFQAESVLPARVNYVFGDASRWHTNILTYARLRAREVYPGIDVLFYGNQTRLEYDFVVSPGADPGRIELRFDGMRGMEIDASGDLLLQLGGGVIRQHKPVVYQEIDGLRRMVEGGYEITDSGAVRFIIGDYDSSVALVIDPVLAYSTYFGSSGLDEPAGMAVDASGNVFVAGTTRTLADFPFLNAYQTDKAPQFFDEETGLYVNPMAFNAFLLRLSPEGALEFATYFGGASDDYGLGLALDNASNAYLCGATRTAPATQPNGERYNFPITAGAYQTTWEKGQFNDGQVAFVAKFNAAGGLVYSTFLMTEKPSMFDGPTSTANSIAVDSTGNAYVTGWLTTFAFGGSYALFVAKLNSTGTAQLYEKQIPEAIGNAIAVDAAGAAYVTGVNESFSTLFPTTPSALHPATGSADSGCPFFFKLDGAGDELLYATLIGPYNGGSGRAVAVDSFGHAYVAGDIGEPSPSPTPRNFRLRNPAQAQYGGGFRDVFVAKFDPTQSGTNSLLLGTYLGGSANDRMCDIDQGGRTGTGLRVDALGHIYVAGATASTNFPLVDALQTNFAGGASDAFVAQLDGAGHTLIFSTYLGGTGSDSGNSVAVDLTAKNLFVAGTTASADFPTLNAVQPAFRGGEGPDAFVTRVALRAEPRLIALEVTQGVQDWQNTVPLVKGKSTFVRAFVELDGPGEPQRVQAVLHGRRNGQPLPDSPLRAINPGGFIVARPDAAAGREFWGTSLNFRLPDTWTEGVVELELDAEDLACAEAPVDGTNDCEVLVEFQEVPPMKVKFVGINWIDLGFGNHPAEPFVLRNMAARLHAAFPIAELDARLEVANWTLQAAIPEFAVGWDPHEELQRVNSRLLLQYEREIGISGEEPAPLYYGALIHSSDLIPGSRVIGAGLSAGIPGRVASGFVSFNDLQRSRHVHTHELGHLLGRTHSVHTNFGPCIISGTSRPGTKGGACGECSRTIDPDYPLFQLVNGSQRPALGPMSSSPYDLIFGLDTSPFQVFGQNAGAGAGGVSPYVISPFKEFDLMSYCATSPFGQWPSSHTYGALLDAVRTRFAAGEPSPPAGTQQAFFCVRGAINFDSNSVAFHPFTRLNLGAPTPVPPGEFTVRLLDAADGVLSQASFAPMMASAFGPDPNRGLFLIPMPNDAAIHEVQLFRGAELFGSITASANAPIVQVLSPNGGEVVSGETLHIQWQASDPDGDALVFDVEYSSDNGTNWSTLLIDGAQEELHAPLFNVKGSAEVRVRVTAKDGFHSAMDESDGLFSIQELPPVVTIGSPQAFETFSGEQTIVFQGSAFDATDGELKGTQFVWRSDRDGVLGSGRVLLRNASDLALGDHLITLSATDNDGTMVERAVQISIATIVAPRLAGVPRVVNGNLEIEVLGEMGTQVTLQSSVDLSDWSPVQTMVFESDLVRFTIPFESNEPHRFYRAIAMP